MRTQATTSGLVGCTLCNVIVLALAVPLAGCTRVVVLGERHGGQSDGRSDDWQQGKDTPTAESRRERESGAGEGKLDLLRGDWSGKTFACGDQHQCRSSTDYCHAVTAAGCGTMSMPDAGGCPLDCKVVNCNDTPMCQCWTHSCKLLPSGCTSCACIPLDTGCQCAPTSSGLLVKCLISSP